MPVVFLRIRNSQNKTLSTLAILKAEINFKSAKTYAAFLKSSGGGNVEIFYKTAWYRDPLFLKAWLGNIHILTTNTA